MNEHDYALRDAAMAEFVDSYFKARPQLLRTRHEECLVEAGFKAAWKPDQTERAEKAEAELARMREQKPLTWGTSGELMDILKNPIYSSPAPVPAVPEDWREVMKELADDLAIEIDQNYPPERRAYPSEQRKYEGEMAPVYRARTLLQSATQSGSDPVAHHPV